MDDFRDGAGDFLNEKPGGTGVLTASVMSGTGLTAAMHSGIGIPSPFMREIFLTRQSIVGTRYQGGSDALVRDLKPGSRITFLREPENPYDKKAVMALDEQGHKLGYLPRHENAVISALMDAGKYFYGIITEKPEGEGRPGSRTPYQIWMDLYMREFSVPGDFSEIPRQGFRGSYAVIDIEFLNKEKEEGLGGLFAVKVINGEERGCFRWSGKDSEEELPEFSEEREEFEEKQKYLREFCRFAGCLPLVGYDLTEEKAGVLAEAYGVMLGLPFSNRLVDIRTMAKDHLPALGAYTLENIAGHYGLGTDFRDSQEKKCRLIWQIYGRFES